LGRSARINQFSLGDAQRHTLALVVFGEMMSRIRAQRATLAAEQYWFGEQLGAPKVYDSGTSFHASPTLRSAADTADAADDDWDDSETSGGRRVRIRDTATGWDITFDEA
jgi:hypothetical protein